VEDLSTLGPDVVTGTGLVLAAAIAFAFYQLLAKDSIGTMGPRLFTCVAMTGASLGAFAQFFAFHPARDLLVSRALFGYGLLIAIAATVLPSFFLSAALHRISAAANSTIGIVSPMVTIILAAIVLGEKMSVVGLIGAALVFVGVGWFTLAEQKR
jgi:drug/metabolite transporter (DMT)-like permease